MSEKTQETSPKIDISKMTSLPPEEIQNIIDAQSLQLAKEVSSSLLLMYYPPQSEVGMYSPDVAIVYNYLKKIERAKKLTVLIHSGGGDIHTAYKLVKLFQRCCEYDILVPEYAKSAATLVALGADRILMSPIAELGPLDPIIQISDQEGSTAIPGFAIRNATHILEKEIEACKDPEIRKLKAEHILGPIAVKIDPYLLATVYDMPELATKYGKKILQSRKYAPAIAERICKTLTELGHPSHGYVVDLDEAKEIGLRAVEMPETVENLSSSLLLVLNLYERARSRNSHPMRSVYIRFYEPPGSQQSTLTKPGENAVKQDESPVKLTEPTIEKSKSADS